MNLYSSDIAIKARFILVARNLTEALGFIEHPEGLHLTVPHDEFFSDRLFDDPLLREFSFSTSFTLYGVDLDEPFSDGGPVNECGSKSAVNFGSEFDTQRSFDGIARLAATVYIKADNFKDANKTFRALDGSAFAFAKEGSIAALGRQEVEDFAFWPEFTCKVTRKMALKYRGPCPSYDADAVDRKVFVNRDGMSIVKY
jgi:hypothetical protein